ncbi:hypothetical protein OU994_27505 [Pseudoduganella sp. SL102]|uniref:hypothetical protein n=1 Tax=Pseudoduganella sp. SL102 TaxID=2995154 RepID=UPI00248CCD6F|nr:hypothetical protein [Pseudoduganella sp. SL102]WBS01961.1 hypothetical protein OU994_27505 [Pseudoduganella sp. SL102]
MNPAANPANNPASNPADTGTALEVTFDGRHYHFRQHCYDRLDDALRYASAQHATPGFVRDPAFRPQWLPEFAPDEAQLRLMRELDIGFAAGRFSFGAYRYDRLEDAVAFARHARPGGAQDSGTRPPDR